MLINQTVDYGYSFIEYLTHNKSQYSHSELHFTF